MSAGHLRNVTGGLADFCFWWYFRFPLFLRKTPEVMGSTKSRRYWGTQHVARVCQVTPATVAHWIDQGHLRGHRTPTGHRRVVAEDLIAFLEQHDMAVPEELQGARNGSDAIVVVEDDPSYRRAIVRALEAAMLGARITAAPNGVDGLLEIGAVRPKVVVLDYGLPDLNAQQVVERLLAPSLGFDAEVVIVTGGLGVEEERGLQRIGVRQIIDKSAGMPAVVEAIAAALKRRRAAAA